MSRKAKRSANRNRPRHTAEDARSPETQASAALEASRFREAIDLYKGLLKVERRQDWVDALAAAYAGRAGDLAAKGMYAEALALWRNRAQSCAKALAEGPYLEWLLQAGEHDAALRLLAEAGNPPGTQTGDLETRLAALALTAPDEALSHLHADSALRRHRAPALAALAAYSRGDFADLDEHLRSIPFRSPYRDLRVILKALALLPGDPVQAGEQIARVAAGGPFEQLAAAARVAVLPDGSWLQAMLELNDDGRQLVLDLKGCPEQRRALLLELAGLGATPAPARILDLLLRRSRALQTSAAQLCRHLLPHAADRMKRYVDSFGPLEEVQRERILALSAELNDRPERAEAHWLRAVELLSAPDGTPLQAALILRRLFHGAQGHQAASELDPIVIEWLERSAALDPDDRATHLRLIRVYRTQRDLKRARATLEAAQTRFPNDPEVLLEAVETALAGDAFKKAVGLAKRLLDLDPINSRVRALIGQAHLSHARKQIRARQYEAGGRELDQADEWLNSSTDKNLAKVLRGLVGGEDSDPLLREAVVGLGGDLVGGFYLLLEAARINVDATASLRRGGVDLSITPSPAHVLAFVHALNAVGQKDKSLRRILDTLRAALTRAATADFAEPERILICEALLRHKENKLLRAYAEGGLKRWPRRPVFVFFAAFARGEPIFMLSDSELRKLEQAHQAAHEQGDLRTAHRIRELLDPTPHFGPDDSADEFGPDLLGDPHAVLDLLVAMGGKKAFLDMARQALGAAQFNDLKCAAGGNDNRLVDLLIDLFAASGVLPDLGLPGGGAPVPLPPPRRTQGARPKPDDKQKDLFDD
ncbi:MAG: tetratricopeptide repeat protein [Sterolibacteriaceae bacterium]|uniref:Tetratricopeptide repeat protein n=1 Tax=Candidatus Methylophosphatis roskildensis TaxID=2899263 RepID=A0A9D7E2R4_9PROT|nr:tetratricopeptide repeat protein [Candidatus Methylophosphatis roskildensis]MBK7237501.1 tetratricopeptide repeat protein [Sterolibacteriaceae bacterium]